MSPEGPAVHLARLKKQFPGWTIRGVERGTGWTAHRRNIHKLETIYAPTLEQLEDKLIERERPRPHQ